MKRQLIAASAVFLISAAPPVLPPGTEADRAPDWLVRPDGARIERFYPDRALRGSVEGRVVLTCIVGVDTRLQDCHVASENPPAYGFGDAALKLSAEMRMAPAIRQGLPAESLVRIPLAFKMPEPEPPVQFPTLGPAMMLGLAGGLLLFAATLMAGLMAAYRVFGRRP